MPTTSNQTEGAMEGEKLGVVSNGSPLRNMPSLFRAAMENDLESIVEELNVKKSVCALDSLHYDWTLLHYAARYGSLEVVQYLLDKGANPCVTDGQKRNPAFIAIYEGHLECAAIILNAMMKSQYILRDQPSILSWENMVHYECFERKNWNGDSGLPTFYLHGVAHHEENPFYQQLLGMEKTNN